MEFPLVADTPNPTSRQAGAPCCLVLPPGALRQEAAEALGQDLELLAHPIRLRLLSVLARNPEPVCVCDLEALVPVKQPTVSHHLRILRDAGLIASERRGLWTYYSVQGEAARSLRERIRRGLEHLVPAAEQPSMTRG
jgi:ArsR family transcriptional regulator, arsenate/arsenite/antimonite-responsive transcriptional repressor